ncbi:hypothetical protein V6N11_066236 [Hibiscus sabdariffa]|uniref:MTTase N-terminal domain-containing protein n=2 Tax=Hibiscus sabdariffa TaxID=183260 RepID=A0ABR2AIK5_9ROSI
MLTEIAVISLCTSLIPKPLRLDPSVFPTVTQLYPTELGGANTQKKWFQSNPMASAFSQPGCCCCFRIHQRWIFNSLRFFSSLPSASNSISHRHFSHCPIKKPLALDVSRSFSQSHHLLNVDVPSLHHFTAHSSLTAARNAGYSETVEVPESAEIIFINTCAIRDNAEQKVWQRLNYFWFLKRCWKSNVDTGRSQSLRPPKVVVLGCMAERLKDKILDADKMVDVVCGPDAYRDSPRLLEEVDYGRKGINTLLSLEETGREKSRPVESIVKEVGELWEKGVKEVKCKTLLGLNVNSYNDTSGSEKEVEPGVERRL